MSYRLRVCIRPAAHEASMRCFPVLLLLPLDVSLRVLWNTAARLRAAALSHGICGICDRTERHFRWCIYLAQVT